MNIYKKRKISYFLLRKNFLVHASLISDIKELEPHSKGKLYATDNLSFAIACTVRIKFPYNSIKIQIFTFMKKKFTFCSIAKEYVYDYLSTGITIYFCKRDEFSIYSKIPSKLSGHTYNIISTHGYEWFTKKNVTPINKISFNIDELFYFGIYKINDSKKMIVIKYIMAAGKDQLKNKWHQLTKAIKHWGFRELSNSVPT
jgi:hypothetical protein